MMDELGGVGLSCLLVFGFLAFVGSIISDLFVSLSGSGRVT
jgi:hypothetical protein